MEEHPCSLLWSVLHSHVILHRSCCIELDITLAHWVHQLALYCCYIAAKFIKVVTTLLWSL